MAILPVSLMNDEMLSGTVAASKTLDYRNSSWERVAVKFEEEQRSKKMCADAGTKATDIPIKAAAAVKKRKDFAKY